MLRVETPRDDVDVGLHHHRSESLVDVAPDSISS